MGNNLDPFVVKRGDTRPSLRVKLGYANGTQAPLSDATGVTFRMVNAKTGASKVDDTVATITDAPSGTVSYDWTAPDTDTAGDYAGEFKVTYSDGTTETFPSMGSLPIKITPRAEDIGLGCDPSC